MLLVPLAIYGIIVFVRRIVSPHLLLNPVDLRGLVAIITGSCSGIGKDTARILHEWNATVILGCRNIVKAEAVCRSFETQSPSRCYAWALDLSSFTSIRQFADLFLISGLSLNFLINNGGVRDDSLVLTSDEIESHYQINHLGHFLLSRLLYMHLENNRGQIARIIHVTSSAHAYGLIDRDQYGKEIRNSNVQLFRETQRNRLEGVYGDTKLMQILFSNELQKRIDSKFNDSKPHEKVLSLAVHPGFVSTTFGVDDERWLQYFVVLLRPLLARDTVQGAITQIFAATCTSSDIVGGQYLENGRISKASNVAHSEDDAKWLWETSSTLVGMEFEL